MPVTDSTPGPYAPTTAILALIERYRQKGLPPPINEDILRRAGVSESLVSRTLQALITLDLIDEQGKPTTTLDGLQLAPEAEYKHRLEDWLRSAYADVLAFVDPAMEDDVRIHDAFRSYKPAGQRARMVTLFTGLFAAAGVRAEIRRAKPGPKPTNRQRAIGRSEPKLNSEGRSDSVPIAPATTTAEHKHSKSVIGQLLDKFPEFDPAWSDDIKSKWFEGYQRLLAMGEK
jgi:hypothetical protein